MKTTIKTLLLFSVITIMLQACYEDDIYPAARFTSTGFVPGFKWALDASGSVEPNGDSLMYRWEYKGEQTVYDTEWLENPVYIDICEQNVPGRLFITLQIKDSKGRVSEYSNQVLISQLSYGWSSQNIYNNSNQVLAANVYRFNIQTNRHHVTWLRNNVLLNADNGVRNESDSVSNGSYINWYVADTLNFSNLRLPEKQEWQDLIQLFFGYNLAGFNLQVDNKYGLGLKTDGYNFESTKVDAGEKGYYWTGTEVDNTHAWAVVISNKSDSISFISLPKDYKCKVRLSKTLKF